MKRACIAVLLAFALAPAANALAGDDTIDAYAYRLPLHGSGQALWRLPLTAPVYEHVAHADLRDLRVFNAAGEIVPYAFVPPAPVAAQVARRGLPSYPLRIDASPRDLGELTLSLRSSNGALALDVRGRDGARVNGTRIAGYVLDASAVDAPMSALVVTLAGEADVNARVRVDASDDLASWRRVASGAPLLRLRVEGRSLLRDRVPLGLLRARYLRVTADDATPLPELAAADAEIGAPPAQLKLPVREVTGTFAEGRAFEYDAQGSFDVAQVDLRLFAANTVAPAQVLVREDPKAPWRPLAEGVFYRLGDAREELRNPPLRVSGAAARYWRVELDPRSGVTSASPPVLLLGWQPGEIVFPTRGPGPFELAFGRRDATPGALPVAVLVPGFEPHAALPADTGLASADDVPQVGNRSALGAAVDFRRIALWTVLVLTVIVLGILGVRLLRQPQPRDAP